jgi:hypothetical protein
LLDRHSRRLLAELVASKDCGCWVELAAIANLSDPAYTATNGR